jgi:hypothetical protein
MNSHKFQAKKQAMPVWGHPSKNILDAVTPARPTRLNLRIMGNGMIPVSYAKFLWASSSVFDWNASSSTLDDKNAVPKHPRWQ